MTATKRAPAKTPKRPPAGRARSPEARESAALALATGQTIKSAAETVGVNEKTVRTWRLDPEFLALVSTFRAEITDRTIGLEARLRYEAFIRAAQGLQNPDDRVGLRAADVLLRNTNRSAATDPLDNSEGTLLAYLRALG